VILARARQALRLDVGDKLDLRAVVAVCWKCDSGLGSRQGARLSDGLASGRW
jgi:hypothetical protein